MAWDGLHCGDDAGGGGEVGMDVGHGGCGGEMVVRKALERESKGAGGGLRGLEEWGGGGVGLGWSFMLVERGKIFKTRLRWLTPPNPILSRSKSK